MESTKATTIEDLILRIERLEREVRDLRDRVSTFTTPIGSSSFESLPPQPHHSVSPWQFPGEV